MIINEDRFFLSHRRPVAEAARKVNFKTVIVTKDTGFKVEIKKLGFKVLDLPINPTGMNLFQELRTMSYLYRLYRRENRILFIMWVLKYLVGWHSCTHGTCQGSRQCRQRSGKSF